MGTFLLRRSGIDWVKTVFNGGIIYTLKDRRERRSLRVGVERKEGKERALWPFSKGMQKGKGTERKKKEGTKGGGRVVYIVRYLRRLIYIPCHVNYSTHPPMKWG